MVKLLWGTTGEKRFETGIDRGVLYIGASAGVPWDGLVSVNESPNGGEPTGFYLDGIKYLNLLTPDEYAASIEAITYPKEFLACDGLSQPVAGLFFDQQPRTAFSLSYRTKIGNDVSGVDLGYKIHLVYNAKVAASAKTRKTLSNTPEPAIFSWELTVTPVAIANARETAHLIIDSTKLTAPKLLLVENALYGTVSTAPYIPTPAQLLTMLA